MTTQAVFFSFIFLLFSNKEEGKRAKFGMCNANQVTCHRTVSDGATMRFDR